jgi:predicted NAD-dependent protein-ADP-ribosyltransferase YbiA (DUF1768 family)
MKMLLLLLMFTLNLKASTYPEDWFRPVPTEGAPTWEVLPQEAGPGEVILSKRNELGILSNFAATPFTYHGKRYASVEGFWQMMKYPENDSDIRNQSVFPFTRDEVAKMTSFEAKSAGDIGEQLMLQLGIDWVSFEGSQMEYCSILPKEHYQLIKEAMWEKLQQNAEAKRILLATGDLKLRPDHHPDSCLALEWRYYDIWMEFRSILK